MKLRILEAVLTLLSWIDYRVVHHHLPRLCECIANLDALCWDLHEEAL
jgi:hypothetical protein